MVPRRLALYFMLRVMQRVFVPWVHLTAVVAVKRLVVGRFTAMTAADPLTAWELTRRWIMRTLLPTPNLCGVLPLVGTHYETISCVFRALGARVGARVFWPGSGVYVADGAFDLLEVGNDAVWGSRTLLFPANALHALPIKIAPGANVADRCVVLAGVTVEAEATLGSGSLAAEGFTFPEGSVWVGARDGNAVLLERGMEEQEARAAAATATAAAATAAAATAAAATAAAAAAAAAAVHAASDQGAEIHKRHEAGFTRREQSMEKQEVEGEEEGQEEGAKEVVDTQSCDRTPLLPVIKRSVLRSSEAHHGRVVLPLIPGQAAAAAVFTVPGVRPLHPDPHRQPRSARKLT
jgi:carbonic anhydrase/acetyltransferase-like protein (isoleucine patch superfamily)